MSEVLTTAGAAHILEREGGGALTNAFGAFELGQGNDTPVVDDDRSDLTSKIGSTLVQVSSGYPVKGDSDVRNEGRAADVWTWRCVFGEETAFIASNLIVTNWAAGAPSGTEPVLVHAQTVLAKRADQEMVLFVNVSVAGAVTVVAHVDDATLLPEQMVSWSDRAALASGQPGSQQRGAADLFSPAKEGQSVPTLWFLRGAEGEPLLREDCVDGYVIVSVRAGENRWERLYDVPLELDLVLFEEPQRKSSRWRFGGGYLGAWTFEPEADHGARRTQLEIVLLLADGTERAITHEIDYRPVTN